ncbi:MAG: PAS domain-containing sensor histidine kinase, partial [Rhodocyclaceae bacterium]
MTPTARSSFLRHWRWGLAALATLLLIVAVGRWAEKREFQLKAATLRQAAEAHALGLRGIVEKHDYLPYVAARHPDVLGLLLRPADPALPDRVNRYLADLQQRTGAAALFVVDAQGQT